MPESLTTIIAPVVLLRMMPPVTGEGGMSLISSVCCSSDWMQMFGSAGLPARASGGTSPVATRQPVQMGCSGSPFSNSTHTPAPMGEVVGAHKAVLAKLPRRDPLSDEEIDYATELVNDARSPLAYAIPAALFTMGFFYVVGCLYELQVHGGHPSFRTFIGGIPMLTSMNIAAQLRRVARLKKKLRDVQVTTPESADELSPAEKA